MASVITAATAVPAASPMSFEGEEGQRLRTITNTTMVTMPTSTVHALMP